MNKSLIIFAKPKIFNMKRSILFFTLLMASFSSAQFFDDLKDVLAATSSDAQLLADAYISPVGQSLAYGLNTGWTSSAKTHKKLGFDLTIGAALPRVSDAAKTFNTADLGLKQLVPSANTASTVFGSKNTATFTESISGKTIELPGFEDDLIMNSMPVPYIQAGVGLFFDTDLIVRYVPKVKTKGLEVDVLGIGIKHNLMQYFGVFDKLPLNVSALASFSKLNGSYQLSNTNSDQQVTLGVDTFMLQALASLDFPIISVVGGLGYGKGDASIKLLGDYSTEFPGTPKDPINSENTYTGMHAMIGARANLLFLKIFANYTLQEFNTLNLGVSFNFR